MALFNSSGDMGTVLIPGASTGATETCVLTHKHIAFYGLFRLTSLFAMPKVKAKVTMMARLFERVAIHFLIEDNRV